MAAPVPPRDSSKVREEKLTPPPASLPLFCRCRRTGTLERDADTSGPPHQASCCIALNARKLSSRRAIGDQPYLNDSYGLTA
jgi:hypothetical protein